MCSDDFRPILGYPNYLVSRDGRVWSLVRNKELAQVLGHRGYYQVNLYRDGKPKQFLVHRLVAAAFHGPIPPGMQVNHKTGGTGKTDNRAENLEICTPEANRLHARENGLMKRGEENPNARLTEEQVREMRRRRSEGARVRDLAWEYDCSEGAVYLATRGATWGHVK